MGLSDSLPPWLSINPRDFVLATQAGVQAGHAIADSVSRAWEENQRMQMANQRAHEEEQQHAVENSMARLAADRLEQYRKSEIENRKSELGIQQRGLGLRGEGLDLRSQRIEDLANAEKDRQSNQLQRMRDLQAQRDFRNEIYRQAQKDRDRALDLREKDMERARGTPHYTTRDNVDYVTLPGSTNAVPINYPKKESGSSGPSLLGEIGGRLLQNIKDNLNFIGLSPSSSPAASTNAPPNVGLSYAPQETQAAPAPVPVAAPTVSEVVRTTNDGRKAVFDANTKKFIRYADQ